MKHCLLITVFCLIASFAYPDVITLRLTNGDTLSGEILAQDVASVVLRSPYLGTLTIDRQDIAGKGETPPPPPQSAGDTRKKGEIKWENHLQIGFGFTGGNTELLKLNGGIYLNRNKLWVNEWTFDAKADYILDKNEKIYEKWEASLRYGHSFTLKFYGFISLGASRNFSTLLNANLLPRAGLGYWIFDVPDKVKLMGEISGGYSQSYYAEPRQEGYPIAGIRAFLEWHPSAVWFVHEDLKLTPNVLNFSDYTFSSAATAKFAVNKSLNLNLVLENSYDSTPEAGILNWDHSFYSGIEWNF